MNGGLLWSGFGLQPHRVDNPIMDSRQVAAIQLRSDSILFHSYNHLIDHHSEGREYDDHFQLFLFFQEI